MTVPTTIPTMTALGRDDEGGGRKREAERVHQGPEAGRQARFRRATPTALASTPTTSASPATCVITCRSLAPSARSSAISRARCATMIEKVL